ncbi:hypothetical protein GTU99_07930 [Streptomyces sp. PRKS01-65]|nr:hypothetical protein [Streptomyces harenosi]
MDIAMVVDPGPGAIGLTRRTSAVSSVSAMMADQLTSTRATADGAAAGCGADGAPAAGAAIVVTVPMTSTAVAALAVRR